MIFADVQIPQDEDSDEDSDEDTKEEDDSPAVKQCSECMDPNSSTND